jgi:hypothetical protein
MSLLSGSNTNRYSQFPSDLLTGDGTTTSFTLSRAPASPSSLLVTIDGVKQHSNTFTTGGSQIIFTEAPPLASAIEVVHLGAQGTVQTVSDSSITASKMSSDNHVGGSQYLVRLNPNVITSNQTIPAGQNGVSGGPITIADGVTVVISDGAEWSIV